MWHPVATAPGSAFVDLRAGTLYSLSATPVSSSILDFIFYNGTLTVFIISFSTASASSLRRIDEEKRVLTSMR